jgi:hypothetical protein
MPLDAEPSNNKVLQRDENLDVVRTSRDQENLQPKGSAGESARDPHLSVVCPFPFPARPDRWRKPRGRYRAHGSKYISVLQATNIIEALKFAKSIGLPLVAHLTVHWSGTVAFDDPDGTRFAKVREGLAKILIRRGIAPAWVILDRHYLHRDPALGENLMEKVDCRARDESAAFPEGEDSYRFEERAAILELGLPPLLAR